MNLEPSSHHPLGPSQWPAWALCASYDGEKDIEDADIESLLPESKRADNEAKNRGQAQHGALAKALQGLHEAFAGLSEEEEKQVRWAAEESVSIAASYGYTPAEFRVETRLTLFDSAFKPIYFGTPDNEFGPVILDAKFGDMRNYFPQLCGYALAKMDNDGSNRVYAKLLYARAQKVVHHTIDRETAEAVAYGILAKRNNPYRQPTPCDYCGWCKHKADCSALTSKVNVLLDKREDWAVKLPTMHAGQAGADPVLIGAMKYIWKAYIEPWGKGVDYTSNVLAGSGNVPLGFKKQDEKGRLEIDGAKAFAALTQAGIPLEVLVKSAEFSMKGLVEAYRAQFGGSEAAAKTKIETILVQAGAAARGEASFKLIRKSDAEQEVRAALARPVLPLQLSEQATNPTGEQGRTTT